MRDLLHPLGTHFKYALLQYTIKGIVPRDTKLWYYRVPRCKVIRYDTLYKGDYFGTVKLLTFDVRYLIKWFRLSLDAIC